MTALTVAGSAAGARRRDAEGTGVADELEVETRGYARTLVRVGLLLRLVALAAALVGVVGPDVTAGILVSIVLVSLTSFVVLFVPSAGPLLSRHPMLVVADSLLAFAVLAFLGPGSPVGLAAVLTALVLGALFDRVMAAVFGALLLALYTLAVALSGGDESFMTLLGLPVIYVCFLVVGACARAADESQRTLVAQVVGEREARAAAEERARLARELHDSVGKSLYGIAMLASVAARGVEADPVAARAHLDELERSARDAAADARRLVVLQRAAPAGRPLAEALDEVCAAWSARTGVPCDLVSTGSGPDDAEAGHETVAVVLEALENVARHARASRVVVTHETSGSHTVVSVSDDGVGFDHEECDGAPAEPAGHYGLVGMTERANRCGGTLAIDSCPGRGTTVTLTIGGAG